MYAINDSKNACGTTPEPPTPKWKWIFPTTWLKKFLDYVFKDAKHVRCLRRQSTECLQRMERVLVGLPYSLPASDVTFPSRKSEDTPERQWVFPLREWAYMYDGSKLTICYLGLDYKGRSEALLRGNGDAMNRHVHLGHDETIFVLEGTMEDMITGKVYGVSSRVSVPKNITHEFKVNGLLLLKWYPPLNILTSTDL